MPPKKAKAVPARRRSTRPIATSTPKKRTSRSKKRTTDDDDDEYTPSCDERFDDSSSTSSSDEEVPEPVKKRRGRVKKEIKVEKDVKSEISSIIDNSGVADVGFDDTLPDVDKAVRGILEDPENILTPVEVCKCHICDGVFDDTNELEFHLASEHASSSVVSNGSSNTRSTGTTSGRKRRSSGISGNTGNHVCGICSKKFRQKGHLTNHVRLHTGERPYSCDICGKRFFQSGHLLSHIRSHTNTRPYECQFCQKKFLQSGHLKNHERLHSGKRPYTCNHCGKGFNQSGHLVNHIRLHVGERPFECAVCAKKFTQSGHLNIHMKLHNAERRHECEVCHKRFLLPGHLSDHSIIHKTERPHQCNLCPKSYTLSCYLISHLLAHEMPKLEVMPTKELMRTDPVTCEDTYVAEVVTVPPAESIYIKEEPPDLSPCSPKNARPVIIKVATRNNGEEQGGKLEEEEPLGFAEEIVEATEGCEDTRVEESSTSLDCHNAIDADAYVMDDYEDFDFVSTVMNITSRPLPVTVDNAQSSLNNYEELDYTLTEL